MGIYDREYYREERRGVSMRGPRTVVGALILVNVLLYLADGLLFSQARAGTQAHALTHLLSATDGTLGRPWLWWQLVTYGFVHSPSIFHILFNMVQLWFLGREVESRYGSAEFLRIYLTMLVVGSLTWCVTAAVGERIGLSPEESRFALLGASGAVSGVVFLFVLNFPQRTLMLFPIPIPIKAWVIGVLLIAMNVFGQASQTTQGDNANNTAYLVHLAGIAFAYLYFRYGWNLGRVTGPVFSFPRFKRRPSLRIHDPQNPPRRDANLGEEVDRILAKIHGEGESSLTRKERRTLENASRQYQKKRQGSGEREIK